MGLQRNQSQSRMSAKMESLEGRTLLSTGAGSSASPSAGSFAVPLNVTATHPRVTATRPALSQTRVSRDTSIAADLSLPAGGLSFSSVNSMTVKLYRSSNGAPVAANVNTSGGGDVIVLQP